MSISPSAAPYPVSENFPMEVDTQKDEFKFDSIEISRRIPKIKIFTKVIYSSANEEQLENEVNEFLKNMTNADPKFELIDVKQSSMIFNKPSTIITYTVIYYASK